jgi:predicted regulator of Ras-like GTPase activity (Roadblock/LC7/MglB family)
LTVAHQIAAALLNGASVEQCYFQTEVGYIIVYKITGNHVLYVIATNDAPLGLVDWAVKESHDNVIKKLQEVLMEQS